MRGSIIAVCVAAVLIAPELVAQGNQREEQGVVVPDGAMPPAGMCRVWLRDVPERQQPAPTDCATALRTRPRSAILLFGDLSTEVKQPPEGAQASSPAAVSARSIFDEPFGRNTLFRAVDLRITAGTMSPSQALRAADALRANEALRAAPASASGQASVGTAELGKAADQTKAVAVKRPEPPPQH